MHVHWLVLNALDDYMERESQMAGSYVHHTIQTWNKNSSTSIEEVNEK